MVIKVLCGYEGCDWKAEGDDLAFNSEHKLMAKLLDHQVKAHNVPPAIWER
jgi:hypothetical protein